jgi:hypothetical protein
MIWVCNFQNDLYVKVISHGKVLQSTSHFHESEMFLHEEKLRKDVVHTSSSAADLEYVILYMKLTMAS